MTDCAPPIEVLSSSFSKSSHEEKKTIRVIITTMKKEDFMFGFFKV
jgi:hypothetical protein